MKMRKKMYLFSCPWQRIVRKPKGSRRSAKAGTFPLKRIFRVPVIALRYIGKSGRTVVILG
jgi:hypothetical protein